MSISKSQLLMASFSPIHLCYTVPYTQSYMKSMLNDCLPKEIKDDLLGCEESKYTFLDDLSQSVQ